MKKAFIFFIAGLLSVLSLSLNAESKNEKEADLTGIKRIAPHFQIFPENKMGNVVYVKNKKLFSAKNLTLKDIVKVSKGYVYLAVNGDNESELGFAGGDPEAKFKALGGGFYQLRAGRTRKIYRSNHKKEIQDLLPKYNTASGLTYNNHDKAAFFHIARGEVVKTGDTEKYKYWFILHVVWDDKVEIAHLPELISDFRRALRLEWKDKDTLKYVLSNGYSRSIRIK